MAPPPAPNHGSRRALAGILFLAAVGESLQVYSSVNSSPQTTELFAAAREKTLMKYVYAGDVAALTLSGAAALVARSLWPLIGGVIVVVPMHWLYCHAVDKGKSQPPPAQTPGHESPIARGRALTRVR